MFKVEDISLFKDMHILNKIETNNSSVFVCDSPDGNKFVVKIYSFEKKKIFINEIKTYFFVNFSPCVLQLLDFGYRDGYYYMIMPYCEGDNGELSLRDKINKKNLDVTEAMNIILVIVTAIMLIKKKYSGFIHGDLKPENILYFTNFYSISDFSNSDIIGNQVYITDTTSAYKAPELWETNFKCEKNDIYSIGLIFYELLTGEHLLSNEELDDEKWANLHFCSENILQSKEKCIDRKDLFSLINKCIKKDYKERYSLNELFEHLIIFYEKNTVNIIEQMKNMYICSDVLKELCLSDELFLRKISDMRENEMFLYLFEQDKYKDDFYLLNCAGIAYDEMEEWEKSNTYLSRALELAETVNQKVNCLNNLALLRKHIGEYEEACSIYFDILGLISPQEAVSIKMNIATIYIEQKKYEDAINLLKKCLQETPNIYELWYNLSIAYIHIENYDKAIRTIQHCFILSHNNPCNIKLLHMLEERRNNE